MKKLTRIMAILGIAVLLSMYLLCFIFALIRTEESQTWFRMALGATIAVPIVLYACLMFTKLFAPKEPAGTPAPEPGSDPDAAPAYVPDDVPAYSGEDGGEDGSGDGEGGEGE